MGVTHYWKREPELNSAAFSLAAKDISLAVNKLTFKLADADGSGEPHITGEEIIFNGSIPQTCETFSVRQREYPMPGRQNGFKHCKTEGLPYDLAVKMSLIILKHHLKDDFSVCSDSSIDEWQDAVTMCRNTLGYGNDFRLD